MLISVLRESAFRSEADATKPPHASRLTNLGIINRQDLITPHEAAGVRLKAD